MKKPRGTTVRKSIIDSKKILSYVKQNYTRDQIIQKFGLKSENSINAALRRDSEFRDINEAIKNQREEIGRKVLNKMIDKALGEDGDTQLLIFLSKNLLDFHDNKQKLDINQNIIININAASEVLKKDNVQEIEIQEVKPKQLNDGNKEDPD